MSKYMKPISKRNFIKGPNITVSIRMPEELKQALDKAAEVTGHSFSDLVQEGLDQWVNIIQWELNKSLSKTKK